jgi:hypothetical protein
MNSRPSSSPAHTQSEPQHKKQHMFAPTVHGAAAPNFKPKTPKLKPQSPKRDDSPKAVGRSARKLEAALLSAKQAYEKEQQLMKQLQEEHQTQLHELLKKRLEFEEDSERNEDVAAAVHPLQATASPTFDSRDEYEAPGRSKRGTLRVHLSPPPTHSPFLAVAEHFDRQQNVYDVQASVKKTLLHSPLATSLLSSVKSRLDSAWLTTADGAEQSRVGKLAAHAREWCFPLRDLPGSMAAAATAAMSAATGEATDAVFDSIFSAPCRCQVLSKSGHVQVASSGCFSWYS